MDTLETLAGTMPDRQVAERLGIGVEAVKTWRRDHGVAPYLTAPPAAEKPADAPTNGSAPARRLVRRRANADEVEVVATRAQPAPVTDAAPKARLTSAAARLDGLRDQMGAVPDDVIAERAGVSRGVVGAYRRKHGIRAYEGYLFKPGHAPLTGGQRVEKPKQDERPAPAATPRRGRSSRIDAFASLVGVESDATVAAKAGVTRAAVTAWRHRQGIPASQAALVKSAPATSREASASKVQPVASTGDDRLAAFRDQMGKVSDSDVAALAGVTREVVGAYRREHGISAWQGFRSRPRRRAVAAPIELPPPPASSVVEPPAAPVRALRAYTFLASANGVQREFFAVGENIATACARAQEGLEARADGPWTVDVIKLLGDAFA